MRTQKGSFQLAAHCYTPSSQFEDDSEQGDKPAATANVSGYVLTLVQGAEFRACTHSWALHELTRTIIAKEHWEPVISRLFDIQSDMQYASIATGVPTPTPIREVWILDYPDDQALGIHSSRVLGFLLKYFRYTGLCGYSGHLSEEHAGRIIGNELYGSR